MRRIARFSICSEIVYEDCRIEQFKEARRMRGAYRDIREHMRRSLTTKCDGYGNPN
ncbi:MAG: hypothetical protein ACOX3L_11080 [Lutisporaceae bacterium]